MKRKILKIACFLSIFAFMFSIFNAIFRNKMDETDSFKIFYEQKRDTIDVLTVGSSRVFGTINPAILYEDYGIASYDLCGGGLATKGVYYYLLEARKTQTPKVVIVGIDNTQNNDNQYVSIELLQTWVGNMKLSPNKIAAVNDMADNDKMALILGYPITHGRYVDDLAERDFLPYRGDKYHQYYKGNRVFWETMLEEYRVEDYPPTDLTSEISPLNQEYIDKVIDLVQEMGAQLIVYQAPCFSGEAEQAVMNGIGEYVEVRGGIYLNLNAMREEVGIDMNTEMSDRQHANYIGQEKITRYIGEFLKSNYDLPDRRGDENFLSWEKNVEDYHAQLSAFQVGRYNGELKGYLKLLRNKNYSILINKGEQDLTKALKEYETLFGELGIVLEDINQENILLFSNGQKKSIELNEAFRYGRHDIEIYEDGFKYDLNHVQFPANTFSIVVFDNEQEAFVDYKSYIFDDVNNIWTMKAGDCAVGTPIWYKR